MRTHHPRPIIGTNKAILFNERFAPGALVAVRRTPGEPASWDRVFAPAYGAGDFAMVELASSLIPVDTDLVFSCPTALLDDAAQASAPEPSPTSFARLVLAFVLGAAAAVLLALSVPAAPATSYGVIGADCDAPATHVAEGAA